MTSPVLDLVAGIRAPVQQQLTHRTLGTIGQFAELLAKLTSRPASEELILGRRAPLTLVEAGPAGLVAEEGGPRVTTAAQDHPQNRELELEGDGSPSCDLLDPGVARCVEALAVDPVSRVCSAPGLALDPSPSHPHTATAFAELWGRLVRRVAWGGDGRRGTARIEIGAGDFAGATIVVHATERQVAVEIELPPGARRSAWEERIAGRLRERGLEVSELIVR